MKPLYKILPLAVALGLMTTACVDDTSTTGDDFTENDNTFAPAKLRNIMDEHEQKVIKYFTTGANSSTGMAYNSSTDKTTLTVGASGMGVMNIIIGVERGWVSRDAAISQVLKIVRFLDRANRINGAWAHWYNPQGDILAFGEQTDASEVVETAFMMGGLLTAYEYFTGDTAEEQEIRSTIDRFWQEIDWSSFIDNGTMYWVWHRDRDEYELPLIGWNETLLVYILGMAAPQGHNIPVDVYKNCWQGYNFCYPSRETYGYKLPLGSTYGGALFLSQYSFLGLDPAKMQDSYCYYWQQNQSHTMINRHYCVYEAPTAYAYSVNDWGLTACAGCGDNPDYLSRDPESDDGVIAPTAAISAFPYTPFYSAQVLLNLESNYPKLNGTYGFGTSYCPADHSVGSDYLGMEHAPMAIMMENYRSGLIWNLLMRNQHVQEGLAKAGISEPTGMTGFYKAVVNTKTNVYDMMRHPDHECYEIDYWATTGGNATLTLANSNGEVAYTTQVSLSAGANVVQFFDSDIIRSKKYTLTISEANGSSNSISVSLR